MSKIKVSADTVLAILKGIMEDEEINYKITDPSAPEEWKDKTIQEALNVEYYTFKHRPMDTELVVRKLIEEGNDINSLYALTRSFCILSLSSTERVFSKDNDIVTISANLEYWVQASKIKLLEDMFEDISIETNGIRIPVRIGNENRQVIIALGSLNISELEETTEFGEMVVCDVDIDMIFYPEVISRSDYTIDVIPEDTTSFEDTWEKLPFSSIAISTSMTQKAVPKVNKVRSVGSINLSRVKTIVLSFDGYKTKFIDKLTDDSLSNDEIDLDSPQDYDNNKSIVIRLTRGESSYIYDCVVKEHTITVQEDTGNETHSLTLTIRGIKDGSA